MGATDWDATRRMLTHMLPSGSLPLYQIANELAQTAIRANSKVNLRNLPRTPWWTPEVAKHWNRAERSSAEK